MLQANGAHVRHPVRTKKFLYFRFGHQAPPSIHLPAHIGDTVSCQRYLFPAFLV